MSTRMVGPPPPRRNPLHVLGTIVLAGAVALAVSGIHSLDQFRNTFGRHVAVAGIPVPAASGSTSANASPGKTGPAPVAKLGDNPLLAAGVVLPKTTCTLPAISRNAERLRTYYQAVIGCLDAAWQPVLAAAGEPFSSPKLEIAAASSQCGEAPSEEEATAYYCSGGRVLFMPIDRLLGEAGLNQGIHLAVLAHEYGHHVQALSGILTTAYQQTASLPADDPAKLETTRRVELQANCFAGLFVASAVGRGSVGTKLGRSAVDSFSDTVADDTHGTIANQVRWGKAGYPAGATAACNTWTAPVAAVS